MSRFAMIVLTVLAAGACGSKKADGPPKEYVEDMKRICHAEEMSGAAEQDPNGRSLFVATWLGNNLVTQDARDLMAKQARLPPKEKAALLRAEAKEAGLSDCPTADTWK